MKKKKYLSVLLVMMLAFGLMLGGCTGDEPQQEEQQKQEEQLEQQQVEIQTLIGEFQGLADGHSAEVLVNGEPQVYQFFDEVVTSAFETMESGTRIQFDVEVNPESGAQTIIKLYDAPAQG